MALTKNNPRKINLLRFSMIFLVVFIIKGASNANFDYCPSIPTEWIPNNSFFYRQYLISYFDYGVLIDSCVASKFVCTPLVFMKITLV